MAMQWLKAAENLLESVDRQAKSAAVPRWDSPRDGGEISSGSEGKAFNKAQGRTLQKAPVPPNTQQSRSEAASLPAKQHEAQQKPSAPSARAQSTVSRPPPQSQHPPQPSLSSATAVPKAEAGGSSYVSPGPIPFDPQPSHPQIPSESSSSAAMLQRPPEVSHPAGLPQRAGSQQAGATAPPSAVLKEAPAEDSSSLGQKGVPELGSDRTVAHQSEPEHDAEPDDGPMEEIQLHTDTESASNEPQEEQRHYPDTTRQSSYPLSPGSQPSEPTASNGAPSLEQSTQAASAAVAEAIAAANRAAEESSGGPEQQAEAAAALERETRLGRVVEQLRKRLEQQQAENEQLEDLLRQADASLNERTAEVDGMREELERAQQAHTSLESDLAGALAMQQQEAQSMARERDAAVARALAAETQAANLKQANDKLFLQQQESQDGMVTALRDEVATAERRLDEERSSHADARRRFVTREAELEANISESAAALAAMQRALEERTRRAAAAEERLAVLELERVTLSKSLSTLQKEASHRSGAGEDSAAESRSSEELKALKVAYQEQQGVLAAAQQHEALLQQQAQGLQQELEQLRAEARKAGQYSDLQRQFQEVTDLLYQKHTQLERMAAEKAAQQLTMEREIATAREYAERNHRRVARASSMSGSDGDVLVPMEAMGEAYNRLANHGRVGSAIKAGSALLDATASTAVRILKQHPLGRLGAFVYIIFIHLFLWIVIQRLQHKALSSDPMLSTNATHMHLNQ